MLIRDTHLVNYEITPGYHLCLVLVLLKTPWRRSLPQRGIPPARRGG